MTRLPLTIGFLLAGSLFSQEANEITFTLVTEEGFNKMTVTAAVPLLGNSSDTSILTGTLDAVLNINEATNQTDTLTFIQADLEGTDVNLSSSNLIFGSYDVSTSGLEAGVETPNPPGVVTPETGEFDASQHNFTVREGTIAGTANDEPINFDFSTEPFVGMGSGTGTVFITPTSKTVDKQFFDVSFVNPVSIADSIETGVLGITADITMNAILKGAGTTFIERADYANWAAVYLDEEDEPSDLSLYPAIPNGLIYALGFDASNAPQNIFFPNGNGFQLLLAATGTREALVIEWSQDLVNWDTVPEDKMLEGSSAIPIGSTLLTIAGPGDDETRYYRVRMTFE
ncbi:hypothetical protein N9A94_01545 [Akkermansiaceae bacterium]|nr:hypothetical protein [Akkermansiaceae bacterium]